MTVQRDSNAWLTKDEVRWGGPRWGRNEELCHVGSLYIYIRRKGLNFFFPSKTGEKEKFKHVREISRFVF